MIRRIALPIAAVFAGVAALAGCSHPAPADLSYAPDAYGVQVGNVYQCYWVYGAMEVDALIAQGHCPPGSVPTRMPDAYLNTYFAYYDSPAYYNVYVPAPSRAVYISTYHTYYVQHTTVITAASKTATWKGSNGKTASGSKVDTAKMKFSTGSGSQPTMGGGNLRGGTTGGVSGGSKPASAPAKAGSTGAKAGSLGGGNLRGKK